MHLTALSDDQLLSNLKALHGQEQRLVARMVAYLVEVEDRRLHLRVACPSLFDFCRRRLGMSEGAAFRRINAARLVRRFPILLGKIAQGILHLSSLVLLRDHLTEHNHEELVGKASGKSKREVQQLLAIRFPKPDVPSTIRKLPDALASSMEPSASLPATIGVMGLKAGAMAPALTARALGSDTVASATSVTTPAVKLVGRSVGDDPLQASLSMPLQHTGGRSIQAERAPTPPTAPRANVRIEPLSASRHKLQLTISDDVRSKIERATELMRHRLPSGDVAVIIERALDLLIANLEKERLGKTARPQKSARPAKPGHVTRSTRREVYARYGEQCAFVDDTGRRCASRVHRVRFSRSIIFTHEHSEARAASKIFAPCAPHTISFAPKRSSAALRWHREFTFASKSRTHPQSAPPPRSQAPHDERDGASGIHFRQEKSR